MAATSPLGGAQIVRLSQAVDSADHDQLLRLFQDELDGVPPQNRRAPRQEDIDYLGMVVVEGGVAVTRENAPFVRSFVKLNLGRVLLAGQLAAL
jgi:hypothetical protein